MVVVHSFCPNFVEKTMDEEYDYCRVTLAIWLTSTNFFRHSSDSFDE